ncbi:MAG: PH domain-containing protein [Muribaculaceae bacterium]|nr:PH domain-containing protein [Muribaculaceae bacterium]
MDATTNQQIRIENLTDDVKPVDELRYERINRKYRNVQMILTSFGYMLLGGASLFLLLIDNRIWYVAVECVIAVAFAINMFILRKAWEYKGYALRVRDITYRSGIVFPKTTTVPYVRLQQVSVKQNPVSKIFGIYAVEIVNGAQGMASLTIPGLSEERAKQIKDIALEWLKNDNE